MKLTAIIACLLVILASEAAMAVIDSDSGLIFKVDQSVNGKGFFNVYQNVSTPNLVLINMGHGSGAYVYDAVVAEHQNFIYNNDSDEYTNLGDERIEFKEAADIIYAQSDFNIGKSFKVGPLKSLISETTLAHNFGNGVAMNAEFRYANKLSKDVDSYLYLTNNTLIDEDWEREFKKTAQTSLNLSADFDGRANIAVKTPNKNSRSDQLLLDEDYIGQYTITKKMTVNTECYRHELAEDWIPCCTNGWSDMPYYAKKGFGARAAGIFDCSCFIAPSQAEFQIST